MRVAGDVAITRSVAEQRIAQIAAGRRVAGVLTDRRRSRAVTGGGELLDTPALPSGAASLFLALPHPTRGAVLSPDSEIVVAHFGDIDAIDEYGETQWEIVDTVSNGLRYADGVALTADGNFFVAGGFDEIELAKVSPPHP